MKRITETTLISILFLLLLAGCTEAEVLGGDHSGQQSGGETAEAVFCLQVMPGKAPVTRSMAFTSRGAVVSDTLSMGASGSKADGIPDSLQTRAGDPGTDQERTISNVWAGQYDATSGVLLTQDYVTSLAADSVVLKLVPSANCNIRFVTNAGNLGATGATTATAIRSESGLLGLKLSTVTTDGKLQNNLCVMTGLCERHDVPPTGLKKEEVPAVKLMRLPAKLTFRYTVNNGSSGFSFTPVSIRVENVPGQVSQIEAPTGQLSGTQYTTTYTFPLTSADQTQTVEYYLPENMAGDGDAVASLKERLGAGVQHATSIVLHGDAVQDGVSYTHVAIRFFPGNETNLSNYDIERNGHYTMNITLGGLDFTDKRVTIETIPTVGPVPTLPAAKGATQMVQITARPGTEWVFDLPIWLSAKLPGKTVPADSIRVPAGSQLSYQGPVNINFKTEESNPRAETREVTYDIPLGDLAGTTDHLKLTQEGAALSVPGGDTPTPVQLGAAAGSTGTFSFTATKGLLWDALFSSDLLDWSGTQELGNETTGTQESYTIVAHYTNPSKDPRPVGSVTVRAGASVSDATYAGLKKEIAVNQAGSVFSVTAPTALIPGDGSGSVSGSIAATAGLAWTISPSTDNGITVSPASGSGNATLTFTAGATEVARTGTFTVSVTGADPARTAQAVVRQKASSIVTIDDKTLKGYYARMKATSPSYTWTQWPPFDVDGVDVAASHGLTDVVLSDTPSMTGYYQLQVESTQRSGAANYATMQSYCTNLREGGFTDWRLPTMIENYAMWDKARGTNNNAADSEPDSSIFGAPFIAGGYWSSSVYGGNTGQRCILYFNTGNFGIGYNTTTNGYVRCVRDKN